ncbi:MAG: prenyltransferase [Chloroflexota bacterium]
MTRFNSLATTTQHSLVGILHLTRWKEQLPLVSLTLLGSLVAYSVHNVTLDWRLVAVALANFLTVSFAFMINDMEDAEDDAKNPHSARRNPITNGSLDMRTAWAACVLFVSAALVLYAISGPLVVLVGTVNLTLSYLYSWKPVRLKSSNIGLDVVSHTLMLGGLLPLAGYFAFSNNMHIAIVAMTLAATLGSTYGQLYNQIRDYETDASAGIVNLTSYLGKRLTWTLAYTAVGVTIVSGVIAFSHMNFPGWLPYLIGVTTVIGFSGSYLLSHVDASGKPALDWTGRLQLGFWFALTVTILVWGAWAMTGGF